MSLWDTIKIDDEPEEEFSGDASFTIKYGCESVKIPCSSGMTLEQAINANADRLGYAVGRSVNFRQGQSVVPGNQPGEPGVSYMASVQLETKG